MQVNVISGKVGFKGDSRFTASGVQVIQLSVSDRRKHGDKVEYLNLTLSAFGKMAEFVEKYIAKGDTVVARYTLNSDIYVKEVEGAHKGYYQGTIDEINKLWENKPTEDSEVKDEIPF